MKARRAAQPLVGVCLKTVWRWEQHSALSCLWRACGPIPDTGLTLWNRTLLSLFWVFYSVCLINSSVRLHSQLRGAVKWHPTAKVSTLTLSLFSAPQSCHRWRLASQHFVTRASPARHPPPFPFHSAASHSLAHCSRQYLPMARWRELVLTTHFVWLYFHNLLCLWNCIPFSSDGRECYALLCLLRC